MGYLSASAWSLSYATEEFPTARKLHEFGWLRSGWHYGTGGPISDGVIARGVDIVHVLSEVGFTRTDAFPSEDGEVLVTAYYRDHYVSILVQIDGQYTLNYEVGGRQISYFEDRSLQWVRQRLFEIATEIWTIYVSSTHQNTITTSSGSVTLPSRRALGAEGCQSSNWTAHYLQAA